jgi:methylenetetrahydrofolate reductase (NADPH)
MESASRLNISFEFFPPKTEEAVSNLLQAASQLAACQPQFFSVTFGAGGSTRDGSMDTVKRLQQSTIPVAPHLSCIGSNRQELLQILQKYKAMGVRRIVALRGDLPSGMGEAGELAYASDLVTLIRQATGNYFHIEVAAYPEIHPQALSARDEILNLKRKMDAGANSAITQYFFNPDAYFYYLEECVREKVNIPVTPGIMPITQFSRLARFSDACGAEIPRWIRRRLESYGDDIDSIKKFGLEVVSSLCEKLIAGGAPGLHFYTLNKAETSLKILESFLMPSSKPINIIEKEKIHVISSR